MTVSSFSIIGVLPITFDAPCFCTPLFRNDLGERYFVQNLEQKKRIVDFQFLAENIDKDRIVDVRRNDSVGIGEDCQTGFRFMNGEIITGTKAEILAGVFARIAEFENYPFLLFYLARHGNNYDLMSKALDYVEIKQAIKRGWITLPKRYQTKQLEFSWDDDAVNTLKAMWENGNSASQIAKALGPVSRNAVIGKAHRLNLGGRIKQIGFNFPPPKRR